MRSSLLLLLMALSGCSSYNILVYIPKFAISHINFMGVVADTMVDGGHNVTALVSEMDASLPDGTKKANILRISPAEGADHMNTHFMEGDTDMFEIPADSWNGAMENARHNSISFCRQCRKLLTTPGLVKKLKDEHFDAIITENFENCGVGLSYLISPRSLIVVSSTMLIGGDHMGVALSYAADRSAMADGRYYDSLYARMMHVYYRILFRNFIATQDEPLHQVFEELYPGTPSFADLISHAAVALPNIEPLTNVAGPTLSKVVPIGGITVGQPKKLSDYWNTVLSLRSKTVFVSFGSIAKSVLMKPARKAALLEAFSSFPDTTFIWKYENTTDFFATFQVAKVPNVVLTEWAPQLDLLADGRISLFISHGGMASCHELSTFGVPSLLVPIFGDQHYNTAGLVHNGIADVLDKFDMTDAAKIRKAIGNVLGDSKYKLAADRIRDQLAARPATPSQQLVSHVEFAARFGPSKSLRPLSLDLSPVQFWGIDLILVGAIAIVIAVVSVAVLFSLIRSMISIVEVRKLHKKVDSLFLLGTIALHTYSILMRAPLVTFLLLLECVSSYKILVYIPKFAISHINFLGKIADTLVEAGHSVVSRHLIDLSFIHSFIHSFIYFRYFANVQEMWRDCSRNGCPSMSIESVGGFGWADRRLSLFITHGGMASCHELTTFGVPSFIVPIFGDQIHNAAGLLFNGIADVFDKFDMTNAGKLRIAIGKMLSDSSYKAAANRLREQLAARPTTPAQLLVSHVEFAARFGPSKSQRPLSLDLSIIQFWGLDLIFIGFLIVILSVFTVVGVLSFVLRLVTSVKIRRIHKKAKMEGENGAPRAKKKRCLKGEEKENIADVRAHKDERPLDEVLPKNNLAGLPEDMLNAILPLLGLRDRSNLALTCWRLRRIEAAAGKSPQETWDSIAVNYFRLESTIKLISSTRTMSFSSNSHSEMCSAMQRVLWTASAPQIHAKFNHYDLRQTEAALQFLSESGAKRISIEHTNHQDRATIDSAYIDALPMLAPPIESNSLLALNNIRMEARAAQWLYERSKLMNFADVKFTVSPEDAAVFGSAVMGIRNFRWFDRRYNPMTTSISRAKIYHSNGFFIMLDGSTETTFTRKQKIEVNIKQVTAPSLTELLRRIPFVN
ncbi:hypothetical protein PRIPAC_81486 [Pristionchus pacificus]|uniref:glucuronosyltransferase n=1 Tax=Pristionchus pacificus TaxID=54126 RepID=A0A2A6BHJ6_PRIPA|nr:hypothetical protein PRIPAC_81486 [Pristionchus pacificus]|eukprot:PDM65281.1 Glycosyltransferase [Pristionchus pacificus]